MLEQIHPDVQRILTPIISRMTAIYITEHNTPVIGGNHNDQYKREKQECVHIIFDGNSPKSMLVKSPDGKLKCAVCGREICTKFDGSSIQTLLEARKVVEQLLYFGMVNHMKADLIMTCIDIKKCLPELATLLAQLNEFVKREESNMDTVSNIGDEYRFRGITSAF
jgi:hypothetical protein